MDAVMEQMKLKNIDKSDWKRYRFDEIAKNVSERVDPNKTDLTTYIGLEHIDSDNIHITRSGTPDDVNGTKLRFYKGDIIFGRRRAYQRKAGIAESDGFCSAHALVLRANQDVIHPKLFPFFMHSDAFMDCAVNISVGSLSPTINWGTLKSQEFLLPPPEEQEKLAELLWAMDEVIEREKNMLNSVEVLLNSFIKQIFTSHIDNYDLHEISAKSIFQTKTEVRRFPIGWKSSPLKNVIINSQNGFAEGRRDSTGIPQLRMNNVTRDGRINLSDIALIPRNIGVERYKINDGDVMFCNTNSEDLVGKSIIADSTLTDFCFSNHFTRLRPDEKYLTPRFLYLWLKFHFDIGLFRSICTRWIGQAAVQTESLMKLHIILPPLKEQQFADKFSKAYEDRIDKIRNKIASSKALQKSLINQIF